MPVVESVVDPSFTLTAGPGAPFRYLEDVVAFSGLQDRRCASTGEVVFVGHGIVAPEFNWNDYAGVDMKGKIALIMVNDPPATPHEPQLFGGDALTYYGRWTYKYEEAARQGAAGAILIHTDASATYPWQVVQSSWSGTQYSLPAVTRHACAGAEGVGHRSGGARDRAAAGQGSRRAAEGGAGARRQAGAARDPGVGDDRAEGAAEDVAERDRRAEGHRPDAKAVIYTSHYDHMGMREPRPGEPADADRIYNGALDNARGWPGRSRWRRRSRARATRPRRSIYILFTTAEESGLLGAEYFASAPGAAGGGVGGQHQHRRRSTSAAAHATSCCSAPSARRSAHMAERARGASATRRSDPIPSRAAAISSGRITSRWPRSACRRVSISDPVEYIGKDPGYAKKLRDEYNEKDYHQPSDEFKEDWDYAGAVDDMRFLAELGWRIASARDARVSRGRAVRAAARRAATR